VKVRPNGESPSSIHSSTFLLGPEEINSESGKLLKKKGVNITFRMKGRPRLKLLLWGGTKKSGWFKETDNQESTRSHKQGLSKTVGPRKKPAAN